MTAKRDSAIPPREGILNVATDLFSSTGYAGTTVRDIADAVGILPGSLYAHIRSKEDLLIDIVEAGIDRFLATMTELLEDGDRPADELLRDAIERHVKVVADDRRRTLVVFHQWRYLSDENRRRVVEKRQRYEGLFSLIIARGVKQGTFEANLDQRIAVLSLLGTLNWTAEWLSAEGPEDPSEVAKKMGDIVLHGLLAD